MIYLIAILIILISLYIRNRNYPLYFLILVFLLFPEMGENFTSFNGSFFFNQKILNFGKLKIIEIYMFVYFSLMLISNTKEKINDIFTTGKWIRWWFLWVLLLAFVEAKYHHGNVNIGNFRVILFILLLSYVLYHNVTTIEEVRRIFKILFGGIILKIFVNFLLYIMHQGDYTTRGYSILFWDDKVLKGFVWYFFILITIIGFRNRLGKSLKEIVLSIIITVFIFLTLRRSVLFEMAIGIGVLFFVSAFTLKKRFLKYFIISVFSFFLFIPIISGFVSKNSHIYHYLRLLNVFSERALEFNPVNKVHVENIYAYLDMFEKHPEILSFGYISIRRGDYEIYYQHYQNGKWGVAHNAIARSIYTYGFFGVVLWIIPFLLAFSYYKKIEQNEKIDGYDKALILGTYVALLSEMFLTLTFIPPYFTAFKGFFFIFLQIFLLEKFYNFYAEEKS